MGGKILEYEAKTIRNEGLREGMRMLVDSLRSLSIEDEAIFSQLIQRYQLTREEADALLKKDRRGIDMENRPIRILYEGGSGEIVEKKSRFIATIEKIETEEDALAFIARMKKQYWDARHNCYAFVAGKNHELQRCSDDGEPNGTAGRPMLDVLLREDIHNLAVVVTRYFGGTLLGTGGLVRAYQKAVQEGLKNSIVIEKMQGRFLTVDTDYNSIGKIQYILAQQGIAILESAYTEKVEVKVVVPLEKLESLKESITEGTNGTARFQPGEEAAFAVIEGEIKIL